jgi:hypothetical protein
MSLLDEILIGWCVGVVLFGFWMQRLFRAHRDGSVDAYLNWVDGLPEATDRGAS